MVKLFDTPISSVYIGRRKPPKYDAFGIELEAEPSKGTGRILFDGGLVQDWWATKTDGSLRDGGYEIISKPVPFVKIGEALDYLQKFVSLSSITDTSPRTSTHVHINFGNRTLAQFFNFACAYLLYEDLILLVSGKSRKGNNFAVPLQGSILYDTLLNSVRNVDRVPTSNGERYSSFNVASLSSFNTVEIRCMRGLNDIKQIDNWLSFLKDLYELSVSFKNPQELLNEGYKKDLFILESMKTLLVQEGFVEESKKIRDSLDKNFSIAFEFVASHPTYWRDDLAEYDIRQNPELRKIYADSDLLVYNSEPLRKKLNSLKNKGSSEYLFDYDAVLNETEALRATESTLDATLQRSAEAVLVGLRRDHLDWLTIDDQIISRNT